MPQNQRPLQKLPTFKQLTVHREESTANESAMPGNNTVPYSSGNNVTDTDHDEASASEGEVQLRAKSLPGLVENFVGRDSKERVNKAASIPTVDTAIKALSKDKQKLVKRLGREKSPPNRTDDYEDARGLAESGAILNGGLRPVDDFNQRIAEQQPATTRNSSVPQRSWSEISEKMESDAKTYARKPQMVSSSGASQSAFDRMRPRRNSPELATITIGSKTTTSVLGPSSLSKQRSHDTPPSTPIKSTSKNLANDSVRQKFSSSMRSFAAPGSQLIKTVGKPQSKSRVSVDYANGDSDDEESGDALTATSAVSEEGDIEEDREIRMPESEIEDVIESRDLALSESGSDGDYLDDEDKKSKEDAKVAELIRQAEESSALPSQDNRKRAHQILKGAGRKDTITNLIQVIDASVARIDIQLHNLESSLQKSLAATQKPKNESQAPKEEATAEERLSLSVSKNDFANMQISGQFNLGFILANRSNTDLFIIDQHASDEKYNFERLQSTTVVQNQPLVQPRTLQLTAIEEEIILENNDALLKNGFLVDIDTSGDTPVGQRCRLLSLPMSREVTFDVTDLEELLTLLADSPTLSSSDHVPRPSKVRRMFAMRACRSSVMIGKTLTVKQMGVLVRHMGEIDKPWNCPHGRPTMRHLCGLERWEGWMEGDGLAGMEEESLGVGWGAWVEGMREKEEELGEGEQVDEDQMEEDVEGDDGVEPDE